MPCAQVASACIRPNETAAVSEGGISYMFERALREYPQYSPKALSTDPYVVTFDNFLSDEEANVFEKHCVRTRPLQRGSASPQFRSDGNAPVGGEGSESRTWPQAPSPSSARWLVTSSLPCAPRTSVGVWARAARRACAPPSLPQSQSSCHSGRSLDTLPPHARPCLCLSVPRTFRQDPVIRRISSGRIWSLSGSRSASQTSR